MSITDRLSDADPLGHQLPDALGAPELSFDLLQSAATARPRGALRRSRGRELALAAVALVAVIALTVVLKNGGSPTPRAFASLTASTGQGTPAAGGALQRSAKLVQQRLKLVGADDLTVRTAGAGRLSVSCGGCQEVQAAKLVDAVAKPGRLAVYDWESNVLDRRCRPAPNSARVTGGQLAGELADLTYFEAVQLAAGCSAARYPDMARTQPAYYAVDTNRETVVAGPSTSPSDVASTTQAKGVRSGDRVVVRRVPTGVVLLRAPADRLAPGNDAGWYLLRDRPALTGKDVTNPYRGADPGGLPNISFGLTARAQPIYRALTRMEARRAPSVRGVPAPSGAPPAVGGHFALALDDALLTVPYIDAVQNPDGFDGSKGVQVSGGFSERDVDTIVALLRTGVLPSNLQPAPSGG